MSLLNLWIVAGVVVLLVGGAYLVKWNMGAQQPEVFEIGQTYAPRVVVSDNFASNAINTSLWNVKSSSLAKVTQSSANNLVIDIAKVTAKTAYTSGGLTLKEKITQNDFTFDATFFKPISSGSGISAEGIKFLMAGKDNDGLVSMTWRYMNGGYYLTYSVEKANGSVVDSQLVAFSKDKTTLRISRENKI